MVDDNEKIRLLRKLLSKAGSVKVEDCDDPEFKSWKNLVERTFVKIFGENSTEFSHFKDLYFFYPAMIFTEDSDYSADHLHAFRRDFKLLKDAINQYIEDLEEEADFNGQRVPVPVDNNPANAAIASKVFISHASSDADIVEELVELLESMGLDSNQIFCSSFEGYGIELGDDFLEAIRKELQGEPLVLFVLSKNFYESPVCLCEMGAAWVLSKNHIPILIPPMDYSDIKGVIPLSQGLKINESLKLNLLKEKIESLFGIQSSMSSSTWERKRDRAVARIGKNISEKLHEKL